MSLNTLPPELFICVLANIESRPTLCNLARCSSQLYLRTIPLLYQHVTVQEKFGPTGWRNVQLRNVASLLFQRPDLAGFVRQFTLHDRWALMDKLEDDLIIGSERDDEGDFETESEESVDPDCFDGLKKPEEEPEEAEEHVSPDSIKVDQGFKTAVSALSVSKEEENQWLRKLGHDHERQTDLILSLLLPALLRVEKVGLYVRFGFHTPTHYLERMILRTARRERPFDIQRPFEALTVFWLSQKRSRLQSPPFIASLLKLPAIRLISGSVMRSWKNYIGEDNNLIELDCTSSPLTSLCLSAHKLSTADLDYILRAPKALKNFFYRCPSDPIHFKNILRALEPQKHCLERLGFGCNEGHIATFYFGREKFSGSMISFTSFKTVKVFEITALVLYWTRNGRINVFPPNLETLHLTFCHDSYDYETESIFEAVEHLLAQRSPQLMPSLKKLILEKENTTRRGDLWMKVYDDGIAGLKMVAADQGDLGTKSDPGEYWKDGEFRTRSLLLTRENIEDAIVRMKMVAAGQGVAIELR